MWEKTNKRPVATMLIWRAKAPLETRPRDLATKNQEVKKGRGKWGQRFHQSNHWGGNVASAGSAVDRAVGKPLTHLEEGKRKMTRMKGVRGRGNRTDRNIPKESSKKTRGGALLGGVAFFEGVEDL